MKPLVDELLGLPSGICGGMAGEMSIRAPEYGLLHTFQIVGTVVPVAAGVAWAMKQRGSKGIVVAVHGDAATANGQWHEGLNIAAVNHLPLLLVCENNGVAGNVKMEQYSPTEHIANRASGYGVTVAAPDGNSVEDVYGYARIAIRRVRGGEGPILLECHTNRLGRHKQGMGDRRTPEEMARLRVQDPLRYMTEAERSWAAEMLKPVL